MEKIITQCNRIVYFGVQTQKGNTYFGDDVKTLTPFVIQKSTEIVSVNGKTIPIHSVEKDPNGSKTFFLEDGQTLLIKIMLDEKGKSKKEGSFAARWK